MPPPSFTDPVTGLSAYILWDFTDGTTPQIGPADLVKKIGGKWNKQQWDLEEKIVDDDEKGKVLRIDSAGKYKVELRAEYFDLSTGDWAIRMDQKREFNGGNAVTFFMQTGSHSRFKFYNDYLCFEGMHPWRCTNDGTRGIDWSQWHTHMIVKQGFKLSNYIDGQEVWSKEYSEMPSLPFKPYEGREDNVYLHGDWGHFKGWVANFMVLKR